MIQAQVTSEYLTDESRRRTRDSLLIFTGALLPFRVSLNPEFIGFQARFGLSAQEMFRFGPGCFPTTYESPYPERKGIIHADTKFEWALVDGKIKFHAMEKIIELFTDRKI
jgi:hypothetical protein